MDEHRPIEKTLRECATKRAAQAGGSFELPPATRGVLLQEVSRQNGQRPSARTNLSTNLWLLLRRPWFKLAWGFCLIALAGIAAWQFGPAKASREARLARQQSPALISRAPSRVVAPVQGSTSLPALSEMPSKSQPAVLSNSEAITTVQATVAAADTLSAANTHDESKPQSPEPVPSDLPPDSKAFRLRYGLTTSSSPPALASEPTEVSTNVVPLDSNALAANGRTGNAFAYQLSDKAAALEQIKANANKDVVLNRQHFAQAPNARLAQDRLSPTEFGRQKAQFTSQPRGVLTSFDLEQSGQELRIRDGDGSIYTGYAEPLAAVSGPPTAAPRKAVVTRAFKAAGAKVPATGVVAGLPNAASNLYFFKVSGTNQTLNQKVVFTGNIVVSSNASLPVLNGPISGRAVVGEGQAIPINAMPAQP
jgi:hypothetical protein